MFQTCLCVGSSEQEPRPVLTLCTTTAHPQLWAEKRLGTKTVQWESRMDVKASSLFKGLQKKAQIKGHADSTAFELWNAELLDQVQSHFMVWQRGLQSSCNFFCCTDKSHLFVGSPAIHNCSPFFQKSRDHNRSSAIHSSAILQYFKQGAQQDKDIRCYTNNKGQKLHEPGNIKKFQ